MTWRWLVGSAIAVALIVPAAAHSDHGDHTPAIVIGDSLVYDGMTNFLEEFAAADLDNVFLDAQGGRSIDQSGMAPWGWIVSGLERIQSLKATGANAPVWVIELGSNNLGRLTDCQCDQRAEARRLIDLIRTAVGSAEIIWVNTRYLTYHDASLVFNEDHWQIAREDPRFHVIDWYTHSGGQDWFVDAVHQNHLGSHALARCVARATHLVHDRVWQVAPTTTTTSVAPTPSVPGSIGSGTATATATRWGHTGRDLPTCSVI
jgi:hypothetical protein